MKYLEQCSDKAIYTPILQVLNPASKPQERIAIILYRGSNRRAVGAGCEPGRGRESAAQNSSISLLVVSLLSVSCQPVARETVGYSTCL